MATTKNIQSVERAFAILELYEKTGALELTVKEIADAVELNKSTAFGLINTLANLEYLQQNPETQKYALGLKLLNFTNTVQLQNSIIRIAHPYLESFSRHFNETVHCAVLQNDKVTYIDKVEAPGSITISTRVGTQNDLYCTGVGKCVLAFMPESDQNRILQSPMSMRTPYTITDPVQLREELHRIQLNGYAMDNEEIFLGLTCVAVPIFSAPGVAVCAISVSSMTTRMQIAIESGLTKHLQKTAAQISLAAYGYDPSEYFFKGN